MPIEVLLTCATAAVSIEWQEAAESGTNLGRESQRAQRLVQVGRERREVEEHERLRVPAQRVLEQVRELPIPPSASPSTLPHSHKNKYTHLRVPVRDMLIALPLALLAQRSNNVPQRTQALINALRLPQPLHIAPRTALLQPLAPRKVDEVQAALAALARERVLAADAEGEDRVRARGALVHERRGDGAAALREREEGADLRRGGERDDVRVGDGRAPGFGVVLDVVPLLVELALAEEVVDRLVVLRVRMSGLDERREHGGGGGYVRSRGTGLPSCTASLYS